MPGREGQGRDNVFPLCDEYQGGRENYQIVQIYAMSAREGGRNAGETTYLLYMVCVLFTRNFGLWAKAHNPKFLDIIVFNFSTLLEFTTMPVSYYIIIVLIFDFMKYYWLLGKYVIVQN